MIKISGVELSKNTLNVSEQFIIRVVVDEIFPTWSYLKNLTWDDLQHYTVHDVETKFVERLIRWEDIDHLTWEEMKAYIVAEHGNITEKE